MTPNPFLGVMFHWLGGFASGSFYVPYRFVRRWAWEVYWLVGGFFSWILAPWILGWLKTNDLLGVLAAAPIESLGWSYFWGAMWGLGGLTFGLTMRYLGMSLGMGVALGYCAAFGTLMPPIFHGDFVPKVLATTSGRIILIGVAICLLGIAVAGMAGMSKEREMSEAQKKATIKEFNFTKGILVATFSGVMSASFAYGLDAATPLASLSRQAGTPELWTGLPKLCVVLLGGFTSNFLWCLCLFVRNRTGYQFLARTLREAPAEAQASAAPIPAADRQVPRASNYFFSALAGTTWYMQFFFYTMGETQMGDYKFSSWTLHMASIILFSSLWGIALKEWKGSSGFTKTLLFLGLLMLVFSTIVVGFGNYLGAGGNVP
ncbi:MAG TPA: L-rhamnose/proton symporter RhaT [Verrucomicrobiota bacterium]|nr:L-rhamnose/proton symporter RhaT [Verrucomicrobiota bacterium]HNU49385.1 L-rhamnose/proton symporter RhaT [Verrucomicrobiota bacterium]